VSAREALSSLICASGLLTAVVNENLLACASVPCAHVHLEEAYEVQNVVHRVRPHQGATVLFWRCGFGAGYELGMSYAHVSESCAAAAAPRL
jgi:hypothetical protein